MFKLRAVSLTVVILSVAVIIAVGGCSSKKAIRPEAPKPQTQAVPAAPAPVPVVVKKAETEPAPVVAELKFVTIYFDFDSSSIRADQRDTLNANAGLLKSNPNIRIQIAGHCDERGSDEYNIALGQRRADAVRSFLTAYGIQDARISTISYGEAKPVATGHEESSWSKNRRGEFVTTGR